MPKKALGQSGFGKRVGNAGLWAAIGFGGNSGMRLTSNLVLTRLLSPEIFGLIALAQVFTNGITLLSDVGANASVIRSKRGEDPAFLRTAWSVQVVRGGIVTAICFLIAWPASIVFELPILLPLICALALSATIRGFQSISIARANRALLIRSVTLLNLSTQFVALIITALVAWQYQSVWALVVGAVFGTLLNVGLSHVVLPKFNHKFMFEPAALHEIVKYGKWILLATFFTFIGGRGQQGIFGTVFPVEVIGLVSIASILASVPNEFFKVLLNTVLLPSFSEIIRERPEQLPKVLRKVRLATISVAFPMLFIVAFLAQPIIDTLYDPRYAGAGIMLSLMALNTAIPTLSTTYQNLLLAEGRSDLHALLMFLWALGTASGIIFGFMIMGLVGSLVGVGIAMCLMFFCNIGIAIKRGYATIGLDCVAFLIIVAVYGILLFSLDIPEAYLSKDLVGEILQP